MPTVKDIKWNEDNSIENAPVLSEEELHSLEKRKALLDQLLESQGKAKYKIEVIFAHTRKVHGPSDGMVSIWESGSKFHGGGDAKAYWCPGKERGVSACTGIIPDASAGYGYLYCPECKHVWKGDEVIGEIYYKLDARKWSEVLLKHYLHLGHNADIYLKYPRIDLRVASAHEQSKQLMGEELTKARSRQAYIYPLANIIKDVSAGSDLLERFHAFLTA